MAFTQENRNIAVDTPLGKDVLLLEGFRGEESLSRTFEYSLRMFSSNADINFNDILGQAVTVRINQPDHHQRYINGFISKFIQVYSEGPNNYYEAVLVPWTWFLTCHADCRIFQNLTAPAIIQKVFSDRGYSAFQLSLSGTYRTRAFCVQYRETDLNFISRLMEEEGIYYFFQHDNGKHTLVLADSISAHQPAGDYNTIGYQTPGRTRKGEAIASWRRTQAIEPGNFSLTDYDFTAPSKSLAVSARNTEGVAQGGQEIFDYPGGYLTTNDGDSYSKVRMQERQCQYDIVRGNARCYGVTTGCTFTLADHPRDDQNQEYLVTGTLLEATCGNYMTGMLGRQEEKFDCEFTAIASSQQFRPPRTARRPRVEGPQTAVVVGPSGQEIATDSYGRIKVQFRWDRYGTSDENSSCFIRVAQIWAGKQWGAIFIPRIGQEVVVDFLEGDPDRPIITGSVYNADQTVPYTLPDNATQSGIVTNSSMGGNGFNELRFEDKKGEEQIYIHGQKDLESHVEHDYIKWVGHELHVYVKENSYEHIGGERHEKVAKSHFEHINGDRNLTVDLSDVADVKGNQSVNVRGHAMREVQQSQSLKVAQDLVVKANNIVLEADSNITIKVGGSYIAIEEGGIKIYTGSELEMESPQTSLKGDALVKITGGLVKIN